MGGGGGKKDSPIDTVLETEKKLTEAEALRLQRLRMRQELENELKAYLQRASPLPPELIQKVIESGDPELIELAKKVMVMQMNPAAPAMQDFANTMMQWMMQMMQQARSGDGGGGKTGNPMMDMFMMMMTFMMMPQMIRAMKEAMEELSSLSPRRRMEEEAYARRQESGMFEVLARAIETQAAMQRETMELITDKMSEGFRQLAEKISEATTETQMSLAEALRKLAEAEEKKKEEKHPFDWLLENADRLRDALSILTGHVEPPEVALKKIEIEGELKKKQLELDKMVELEKYKWMQEKEKRERWDKSVDKWITEAIRQAVPSAVTVLSGAFARSLGAKPEDVMRAYDMAEQIRELQQSGGEEITVEEVSDVAESGESGEQSNE